MMSNSVRLYRKWTGNCTVSSKSSMKVSFLFVFVFFASAAMGQSLRDSLFGGKMKVDSGKTFVSKDTGRYVAPKEVIMPKAGEKPAEVVNRPVDGSKPVAPGKQKEEFIKPDESMPDSLNKLYYSKQRTWKRWIESNTTIISQQADETRKVKKGVYSIEIEYEINLKGRVSMTNISCLPYNEFLIAQFTELMKRPPVLAPPIYSDGQPRTMNAKQPVTVTKK